jgi:sortase A
LTATVPRATGPGQRPETGQPVKTGQRPRPGRPPLSLRRPVLYGVGLGVTLLGAFLLGLVLYLFVLSGVQEARSQTILYAQLRGELASQVAPLGPAASPGAPVAILRIPAIGIRHQVIVQGTDAGSLMLGPGHRRDTPMPGQAGVAVVYGRRATFGAPFGALAQLRPGDRIIVTTGQGRAVYQVAAIGGSKRLIEDPDPNRLILVTASSPDVPAYYLAVDARLLTQARPADTPLAGIAPTEVALASDAGALPLTLVWALALVLVSAAGTVAAVRWSPWLAYLATAPLLLAILWNLYQNLAALLPNIY